MAVVSFNSPASTVTEAMAGPLRISVTRPLILFLALTFMAPASPLAMMASVAFTRATTESFFFSPKR